MTTSALFVDEHGSIYLTTPGHDRRVGTLVPAPADGPGAVYEIKFDRLDGPSAIALRRQIETLHDRLYRLSQHPDPTKG